MHAWLVHDLEGQRVRILTQESQIGDVFEEMEAKKPNLMLLGHQDWLDGLITAASGKEIGETNLEAVGFGK
jgi:FKBP-type peptidyl-prolyl cis-trans isomerase 2